MSGSQARLQVSTGSGFPSRPLLHPTLTGRLLTVTPHGRALRVQCPGCLLEGGGGEADVVAASLGLLHPDAGGGSGSPHFPDAAAASRIYLSAAIHPQLKVEQ